MIRFKTNDVTADFVLSVFSKKFFRFNPSSPGGSQSLQWHSAVIYLYVSVVYLPRCKCNERIFPWMFLKRWIVILVQHGFLFVLYDVFLNKEKYRINKWNLHFFFSQASLNFTVPNIWLPSKLISDFIWKTLAFRLVFSCLLNAVIISVIASDLTAFRRIYSTTNKHKWFSCQRALIAVYFRLISSQMWRNMRLPLFADLAISLFVCFVKIWMITAPI